MKQLTFPHPMNCTHIYPDGREERVRYGHFEAKEVWSQSRSLRSLALRPNFPIP
jgi:hypothetical protein